jgi:hypothetical protein
VQERESSWLMKNGAHQTAIEFLSDEWSAREATLLTICLFALGAAFSPFFRDVATFESLFLFGRIVIKLIGKLSMMMMMMG